MRHSGRLCKPFTARFGRLIAFSAYFLIVQRVESAAAYHWDGDSKAAGDGVVDRVSTVGEDLRLTGTRSPGNALGAPADKELGKEVAYLLEGNEEKRLRQPKPKLRRRSPLSSIVTMGLSVALVILLGLISWDLMNFVGDVPDPFENVEDPRDIPKAIERLLNEGKSLAFVVRKCKYCGLGIRAMKNAGRTPVIVMVEGHRHQRAISQYLRSQYSATGYPYFILDRERSGYLSKLKEYLQDETSTGIP